MTHVDHAINAVKILAVTPHLVPFVPTAFHIRAVRDVMACQYAVNSASQSCSLDSVVLIAVNDSSLF